MYEFEVDQTDDSRETVPADLLEQIPDDRGGISGISIIPWEEHCTECAMPQCFETCGLYEPRKDGKCRRFVDGMTRIDRVPSLLGYMVKVSFKRWGQLMAYGNARLVPIDTARRVERGIAPLESVAAWAPDGQLPVLGRRGVSSRLVRRLKQSVAKSELIEPVDGEPPDYFLAEIYNPDDSQAKLSLTIRNEDGAENGSARDGPLPFQELLEVPPGFTRFEVDASRISELVDLESDFTITLNPNLVDPEDAGLELWFGALTFVRDGAGADADDESEADSGKTPVKVVAWDLDNTIWEGTLIEDGPEGIELKPDIAAVIRTLDQRGIVNTVASKNNEDEGLEQLERFGLADYMVFPKISWDPKSVSLRNLVREFNVGEDTIAFVDDSPFERNEVKASLPEVRVFEAVEYRDLPELADFQPPESAESSRRREYYLNQHRRKKALSTFEGEYAAFLRRCDIRLTIEMGGSERLDRINELVQRTNQLNFSGNRYSKEAVANILSDEGYACYVMSCSDNFGDYGTIGFAIVDRGSGTLNDLMFSCRVQGKRVEHAFLKFLLARSAEAGRDEMHVRYFETQRNRPAGQVFQDLGFELTEVEDDTKTYRFDLGDLELEPEPVSIFRGDEPWSW